MTIQDIILSGSGGLLLLLTIIQIAPIKVNPWSCIAKKIGNALNGDVQKAINEISKDLKQHKECETEMWATLSRTHILRFGDEIIHGQKHSKEHFEQVLIDINHYEKYCSEHPTYQNNIASSSISLIKSTYNECLKKNNFL